MQAALVASQKPDSIHGALLSFSSSFSASTASPSRRLSPLFRAQSLPDDKHPLPTFNSSSQGLTASSSAATARGLGEHDRGERKGPARCGGRQDQRDRPSTVSALASSGRRAAGEDGVSGLSSRLGAERGGATEAVRRRRRLSCARARVGSVGRPAFDRCAPSLREGGRARRAWSPHSLPRAPPTRPRRRGRLVPLLLALALHALLCSPGPALESTWHSSAAFTTTFCASSLSPLSPVRPVCARADPERHPRPPPRRPCAP